MASNSNNTKTSGVAKRFTRAIGPAVIVACVVLGPGSILTSSKIGCQFGYEMIWLLVGAGLLMVGAVATSARIGVTLEGTPCEELATRLGRPVAALAGISVFLIAACFQFSNNVGVLASLEPLFETNPAMQRNLLIGLNVGLIACLFGFKRLYQPIERLMMLLVGLMLIGFAANLIMARPSIVGILGGLVPSVPEELSGGFFPKVEQIASGANSEIKPTIVDPWFVIQGLLATTFSIAGAFYQAYLVKEKGWGVAQLKQGVTDSFAGISVLVGISLMIMVTSASVLYGKVASSDLSSAADVARQLEPLFGSTATVLFCLGIFAGAFSSFLVNSIIGGTLLADGLGLEAKMDSTWTKIFTVGVLLIGMFVALLTDGADRVPLIIFAQAMTVLGGPVLAFSMLYLATRRPTGDTPRTPAWILGLMSVGAVVVIALAARTAWRIFLQVQL
ncbi:MAG: divalent metal cation transporter [Planctomycetes bacterium]|nr:divalent metal cation transporter [Planctomycetota bacterium]